MCRSVPQIPVASTRIFTSLMPGSGSGTFSSHRPRSARLFTSAFISEILQTRKRYSEVVGRLLPFSALRSRADGSAHFLRPAPRRAVYRVRFTVGFFHFEDGGGKQPENNA